MKTNLEDIYRVLLDAFGHQGWWPGETPFEVAVGAVLTQNTAWTGVEKAIQNLRGANALDPLSILAMDDTRLGTLIRPSGYFNVKAVRLKALCTFLVENDATDPAMLRRDDVCGLRSMLLGVRGIGRETADSILLYAVGMPVFVVDAYTRRIFGRLGILDPGADYDFIRSAFESGLPSDVDLYKDFHAQIVRCAKDCCRTRPMCLKCPLSGFCRVAGGCIG